MLSKLIDVASVGSALSNTRVLHRALLNLTHVISLAVASAFMCCVLATTAIFAMYVFLVHHGLDSYIAAFVVFGALFTLTAVLILMTVMNFLKLRAVSQQQRHREMPGISYVSGIVDAFIEGVLKGKR